MLYIYKGVYDLSSSGWGLYEAKHKITFIGEPNETIIVSDGTKNSKRDNHAAAFNTDCSVYDIIFKYTVGNRSTNYSSALVGNGVMDETPQYGKFYNCVFDVSDKSPAPCYGNGNIYVQFNNCSFLIPSNFKSTYIMYGSDYTKWLNCLVSKNLYTTGTTCLGNAEFSQDDYSIISNGWKNTGTGKNPDGTQANIGVYGSDFAWKYGINSAGISLNKITDSLTVGQTNNLIATVIPNNTTNKNVKWTSSDPSIATVDENGKVTAVKAGMAIITATTTDGTNLSASCTVNIKDLTNISLNKATDLVNVGGTDNLLATVNPSDVQVTWASSDESIVTVDNLGKIKGIKEGQATITATTADGKIAVCLVTVKAQEQSKFKLILYMNDQTIRDFYLTQDELDDFINWYSLKSEGEVTVKPYYVFNVPVQGTSSIKKSYVWFMKIENFEVD